MYELDNYANAMKLGGSRPLPDLFSAGGLEFDFGTKIMGSLMTEISSQLSELPV